MLHTMATAIAALNPDLAPYDGEPVELAPCQDHHGALGKIFRLNLKGSACGATLGASPVAVPAVDGGRWHSVWHDRR